MVSNYPYQETQGTYADGDNDTDLTVSFTITYGETCEPTVGDLEWVYIKPKQPCFTERGHNWWYYDLFAPIPEKDLKINRIPCGDRSPPERINTLSSITPKP